MATVGIKRAKFAEEIQLMTNYISPM